MKKTIYVTVALLCAWQVRGEVVHTSKYPTGTTSIPPSLSFTEVTETDDGFAIWFHFDPADTRSKDSIPPVDFYGKWMPEPMAWTRFYLDRMEIVETEEQEMVFLSAVDFDFDPWNNPGGASLPAVGESIVVPSGPYFREIGLITRVSVCDIDLPCVNEIDAYFEYSVTEIPDPLPGDFNYDDRVDFEDFVVLSRHYGLGLESIDASFPLHHWGDANLDGITDFDDFTILADNFGTSREAELASVPEPGCQVIVFVGALTILAMRRSR